MKKITLYILVTLFALFFESYSINAQTTLNPGDIAITGFNTDNPDEFSFVLLVDVLATTEIRFTDNGWQAAGGFRNNEGTLIWTATADLTCGTEVIVTDNSPFTTSSGTITDSGAFNLAASGDQILAYQGTNAAPSFVYAIHFDSTPWGNATTPQTTALPTGLTDGTDAVDFGEIDNGAHNCNITAGTTQILADVSDPSNWTLSDTRLTVGTCTYFCPLCASTTTWDGLAWDNGAPTITVEAIINGNYDTTTNGSFSACTLTVNPGFTLTVSNSTFIQVQNDIVADGDITVATEGSVVQVNDDATTTANGTITVQKNTSVLNGPLEYTYWGSPVAGETIEDSFANVPVSRRFIFNAANFVDVQAEINNTGTFAPGQDDIDDDGNAWQSASGVMTPGVGYATTASPIGFFPAPQQFTFQGAFNNGVIQSAITNASGGAYNDWNFLGNPYPSAIDATIFFTVNTGVVDNIYLWSQATPLDANASGNDGQNFSGADYAVISATGVNVAGASGIIPNSFIPSGQGFFVEALSGANVTFNNSMRVTGDNDQFFRSSNLTSTDRDALWLNLTSDNGVFSQIAVAHIDGATDTNDGTSYDVKRNASSANFAKLYSTITDSNDEFVIQGKNPSSLDLDEVIELGFNTMIESPTTYTIAIAQFEGDFYNTNDIYLKDNLFNTLHSLKDSDYSFTSEVGSFTNRFEIVFNPQVLSIDDVNLDPSSLTINELNSGDVRFSLKGTHMIESVEIIDLLGRVIYQLNGESSTETYNLSKLSKAPYIARVGLSNGQVITKKAVKRL
ncbi:MAG: hypothetical protein AAF901_02280 [Bacteroidota bacterium]